MTRNEGNQGGGVREIIRSQPSRGLSFVRFCNATQRKVEVIWMNYEGARVKYKTLEPDEFFDVNTYVAHPWLFQDAVTHERLNANSKHVFEPKPWYEVRSSRASGYTKFISTTYCFMPLAISSRLAQWENSSPRYSTQTCYSQHYKPSLLPQIFCYACH